MDTTGPASLPPVRRRPRPATVPGPLAWVLVAFLGRRGEFADFLPKAMASLSPEERAVIHEYLPYLELTATEYRTWRASEVGTSELRDSAPAAPLPHEISVREAAGMLDVSERRVRQMLGADELEGRKDGWAWLVDRASVDFRRRNEVA